MTPAEYTHALTTLSLTPDQAAIWLGIGRSTAYRYLKTGCEGAVERALGMAVGVMNAQPVAWRVRRLTDDPEEWQLRPAGAALDFGNTKRWEIQPLASHSDLTAAVGLP